MCAELILALTPHTAHAYVCWIREYNSEYINAYLCGCVCVYALRWYTLYASTETIQI